VTAAHALAIFAAGMAAGTINVAVGSGTLVTFPVLLAFGYAPVVANVSNTIGLVPAAATGAAGYRAELAGQGRRFGALAIASTSGGIAGAVLLLELPASAFRDIVPAFIGVALLLILVPSRFRPSSRRRESRGLAGGGALVSGVYGGYFGAAQGILLLSILGLAIDDELQRINALKVVLVGLVNLVSGIVFAFAAHVAWDAAGLIAAGSTLGGVVGARYGRRLPDPVLRAVIVAVGVIAIVQLV